MAATTNIEWADSTWNCLRGCTHVSAGCDHCYAAGFSYRFSGEGQAFAGLAAKDDAGEVRFTGKIMLVESMLRRPLTWKEPRRIFVNSLSDVFHAGVPIGYIDRMFAVMLASGRHTYQILTKRPQRAANYLNDPLTPSRVFGHAQQMMANSKGVDNLFGDWPLRNAWIGTSVEDSRVAHRIDALRKCPAVVRFLSCEPLLGPLPDLDLSGIHWVIAGGESGPQARPMHPDWARGLRDRCLDTGTAFFFKQNGEYVSVSEAAGPGAHYTFPDGATVRRTGKKLAGRTLDGVEWSQFPTVGQAVRP